MVLSANTFGSRRLSARFLVPIALAILFSGCHRNFTLDTTPLDNAGMDFDSVQAIKSLNVTSAEVAEIAKTRRAGLSDAGCVSITRIFHERNQPFNQGDAIAGFVQVGMNERMILELATLNQLGLGAGELQAMHLAGLSDEVILEVAKRHADNKPVFSGAALAGMKNAGLHEATLLELARRGLPDSQADAIVALRRRGLNDAEILKHFTGS